MNTFIPERHLAFGQPEAILKMADIGRSDTGISPVAVAGPFTMFSEEAVQNMRSELLSDEVLQNCKYRSTPSSFQLRGPCPEYAKFCHAAWRHPETLKAVSRIAQVDLTVVMDYEVSHVNVHHKENSKVGESIVGWHEDSYPFVCVVMLSNTSSMVGGVLELKGKNGDIVKVPQMEQGSAVLLQGRYIEHRVPYCADERISIVTSFRPSSLFLRDDTRLTTVRAVSDTARLYHEFFEYRENAAIERLNEFGKRLSEWCSDCLLTFLDGLIEFLRQTWGELWDNVTNPTPPQSPRSNAAQSVFESTDDLKRNIKRFLPVFSAMIKAEVAQSRMSLLGFSRYDSTRPRLFVGSQLGYLEEMKEMLSKDEAK